MRRGADRPPFFLDTSFLNERALLRRECTVDFPLCHPRLDRGSSVLVFFPAFIPDKKDWIPD